MEFQDSKIFVVFNWSLQIKGYFFKNNLIYILKIEY